MIIVSAWVGQYGYFGIFSALVLGIVGVPIPDELLLIPWRPLRKRQPQTPSKLGRRFVLIGDKPDGHTFVPALRLGRVGAE